MTLQRTAQLQRRIQLFAMFGVLVTGLLVGLVTGVPLYQQGRAHSEDTVHAQMHAQAQGVAQYLGRLANVAMLLTSRSVIRDYLEAYNRGEITREELAGFSVARLQDALKQSTDVVGLVRLDASGEPAIRIGLQPERKDWPNVPAQHKEPVIYGPLVIDGEPHLLVGAPIINRQGERVGTDIAVFELDDLLQLLSNKTAFGLNVRQYLASPSYGFLMVLDAQATALTVLPMDADLQAFFQLAAAGKEGVQSLNDHKLFYEPLAGATGWGMLLQIENAELYLPVQQQLLLPVLTILLLLVVAAVLTAYLIRPLAKEVINTSWALAKSEQHLRTLINAAPDIISFKDGEGRWLEVNHAKLALHGLEGVDYRGKTDAELVEFIEPHRRYAFLGCADSDQQAWQRGEILRNEEIIHDLAGKERIYDVMKIPVFGDDGHRNAIVVFGRDVTKRRQAELALQQSAQEWSYAMNFSEDAICLLNLQDRVMRANRACCRLFGLAEEQIIGRDMAELLHPQGEKEDCEICEARRLLEDRHIIVDLDNPANSLGFPYEVSIRVIHDTANQASGIMMAIKDLTRMRQTEEQLRLAASVFENSQEAIVILDHAHRIIEVNKAFSVIVGYAVEEMPGRLLSDLLSKEQNGILNDRQLWGLVDEQGGWQGELWYRHKDGDIFPAWQNFSLVRDAQGKTLRYIGAFTDISDKKAAEYRIHRLAHYDLLTDLPNRVLLQDRLQNALERMRRTEQLLAVLFIDLDRFKNVNDSLGHPVGDRLLQVVAQRLISVLREQDTVARLGGDEFLLILEELRNPQYAAVVAHKILQHLNRPIHIDEHVLYIGASIGISVFPDDGEDVDALVKHADTAMYRAKDLGRNNYQFYTEELTRLSLARFELERDLRQALERDEFLLYYQPQTASKNILCTGAEVLVRWRHPEKGLIQPDYFIPLAEETGLIHALGRWVLLTACRQAKIWQEQGRQLRVAVNLSGLQIVHGDIVGLVNTALSETGLLPQYLELEITEGFVISHAEAGIHTLEQLKALGVTLAIDDFGTGYSSLSYLKRLPIDRLKIDRSFVQGIPDDRDDSAIVATIIAMARNLELDVIAEGVETEKQLRFLGSQGCVEYQGYLFGKPMPVYEFEQLVRGKFSFIKLPDNS